MKDGVRVKRSLVREYLPKGYKGNRITVYPQDHCYLKDLNWSGGTKCTYHFVRLCDAEMHNPDLGMNPPWDNPAEGQKVDIPPGFAVVCHGYFCGDYEYVDIFVHPSNMPKLLTVA
jgi:hypothetical protein